MTRMWMTPEEVEAKKAEDAAFWQQSDEEIGRQTREHHEMIEAKERAFAESMGEEA